MENSIETAANLLDMFNDIQTEENEVAYEIDISNPVCPCCGARLVIKDSTPAGVIDDISTEQIQESFVSGDDIIPLVKETAESICDAYFEQDNADPKELIYITDQSIKSVIHRKAIELCSMLRNNYDIQVPIEVLETNIKKEIKFIVGKF